MQQRVTVVNAQLHGIGLLYMAKSQTMLWTSFNSIYLLEWNWSKQLLTLCPKIQSFNSLKLNKKAFENIVEKGEIAGYQHFLLFPQCFVLNQRHASSFALRLFCHLQVLSIWTSLKFSSLVNYAPLRRSGGILLCTCRSVRRSVRRPHFCPEHNSKSISGIILKLHRWIDLIKEKCSAQEL